MTAVIERVTVSTVALFFTGLAAVALLFPTPGTALTVVACAVGIFFAVLGARRLAEAVHDRLSHAARVERTRVALAAVDLAFIETALRLESGTGADVALRSRRAQRLAAAYASGYPAEMWGVSV